MTVHSASHHSCTKFLWHAPNISYSITLTERSQWNMWCFYCEAVTQNGLYWQWLLVNKQQVTLSGYMWSTSYRTDHECHHINQGDLIIIIILRRLVINQPGAAGVDSVGSDPLSRLLPHSENNTFWTGNNTTERQRRYSLISRLEKTW